MKIKEPNQYSQKNAGKHRLYLLGVAEALCVFLCGASIYFCMEILWRGYSHITMFFAGGVCFSLIYAGEKRFGAFRLFSRCVLYAFAITVVEFVFGVVFNLILAMNVWDYSDRAFNLLGQVCPLFFFLWIGVALPAIGLSRVIRRAFDSVRRQIA